MTYPDRYVITGIVRKGEYKGQRVWLYFSEEGGGWWQWSRHEGWAERFESRDGKRFEDAMNCASGKTWTETGPWYYYTKPETVEAVAVPAIVKVY